MKVRRREIRKERKGQRGKERCELKYEKEVREKEDEREMNSINNKDTFVRRHTTTTTTTTYSIY